MMEQARRRQKGRRRAGQEAANQGGLYRDQKAGMLGILCSQRGALKTEEKLFHYKTSEDDEALPVHWQETSSLLVYEVPVRVPVRGPSTRSQYEDPMSSQYEVPYEVQYEVPVRGPSTRSHTRSQYEVPVRGPSTRSQYDSQYESSMSSSVAQAPSGNETSYLQTVLSLPTLFSKDPCPLCEEAKEQLEPLRHRFVLQQVDISLPQNAVWRQRYALDIPVFHLTTLRDEAPRGPAAAGLPAERRAGDGRTGGHLKTL
ncbi:hypothetical protein F7725_008810 [Dissostichus mawsoni]|uniref:Glutaredoxin-like protein n=1 Tax=Dissostichus mawsoni TaxID=36200 RepID=A0A7J5YAR6_DISMA|nr:hypothetical protein F7725_008810 [Dissostichus mawsoni]